MSTGTASIKPTWPVYPSAIIFAAFSLLITIIILPPLVWHCRNRNIGAAVLVSLAAFANFQNFINAVLWPNDDFEHWFNGAVLCDVEVKIQSYMTVAFPASVFCILHGLANAMDTKTATVTQSTAQKNRAMLLDLICCVFLPLLELPFHYIVQPFRYYVYGIAGCEASVNASWLYFVLMLLPQILWLVIDAYYAVLILVRLIRYRLAFRSIMANNNTTRSRFVRLYSLCLVCLIGLLAADAFTLYQNNILNLFRRYSWSETHNSQDQPWNTIVMVRSYGKIFYDRWIWLTGGLLIFLLFGIGRDAVKMYRTGLLAIGLGRVFPSLDPQYSQSPSRSSSQARLFCKRKCVSAVSATDSMASQRSDVSEEISPKKLASCSTVKACGVADSHLASDSNKILYWILTLFRSAPRKKSTNPPSVPLENFSSAC